jgi:uncharacterized protein
MGNINLLAEDNNFSTFVQINYTQKTLLDINEIIDMFSEKAVVFFQQVWQDSIKGYVSAEKNKEEFIKKGMKIHDHETNSKLIANGYLMTEEKIKEFVNLKIDYVQVTVDGLEEEHNKTRIHKTKKDGSFQVILNNIDTFFKIYSNQDKIGLNIRVNISKTENYYEKFKDLYYFLKNRYPYKNLSITPGFIGDVSNNGNDVDSYFNSCDIHKLFSDLAKNINKAYSPYPNNWCLECAVRSPYDIVVGPNGELYKCWENIGHKNSVVGELNDDGTMKITDETTFLKYQLEADYLENEKCLNCFYFPVCEGGCPEKRIRNEQLGAKFDLCMGCMDSLEEMLDLHYELKNDKTK